MQKVAEAEEAMRLNPQHVGRYRTTYSFYKHEEELLRWVLGKTNGIKVRS